MANNKPDLTDLNAFVAVARAGGFREGARAIGSSASGISEAVRRLEAQLGVRLLNRSTRSPTEAGARLLERLGPALSEVEAALVVNVFRDRPTGTLRLNVPGVAARLVLPASFRDSSRPLRTSCWR
jgi:DNA-binding transcriptional LysR family regulator